MELGWNRERHRPNTGCGAFCCNWVITQSLITNYQSGGNMPDANGVPYEQSDLYKIRHSAAHVMAEAVLSLFPEAKLAIADRSQNEIAAQEKRQI